MSLMDAFNQIVSSGVAIPSDGNSFGFAGSEAPDTPQYSPQSMDVLDRIQRYQQVKKEVDPVHVDLNNLLTAMDDMRFIIECILKRVKADELTIIEKESILEMIEAIGLMSEDLKKIQGEVDDYYKKNSYQDDYRTDRRPDTQPNFPQETPPSEHSKGMMGLINFPMGDLGGMVR